MAPTTRSKMHGGVPIDPTTGAVVVTSVAGGSVTANTELPTAALLADNTALPTTPIVGAALLGYDGTTLDLLRTKGTGWQGVSLVRSEDGQELVAAIGDSTYLGSGNAVQVYSVGENWNGVSYDRQRGNTEGTLLASAARTATTTSATQTNHNARGLVVYLNITVASGTGGLTLRLRCIDPVSGTQLYATVSPISAQTTVTMVSSLYYPGATTAFGGGVTQSIAIPRTWAIDVVHADASSYTYSLGYSLII